MTIARRTLGQAALGGLLASPFIRPAAAQERSITLAAYSGIFQENYDAVVVEPFRRANPNIKVTYFGMPNSAQTLGTLRAQKAAPQIDVAMFDITIGKAATDEGLLDPITRAEFPVLADLAPSAFAEGVNSVGVTFDSLSLLYSPENVRPAPTSWRVLWDPKYSGKIAMAAAPDIVGIGMTLVANRLFGGTDYKDFARGVQAMSDLSPHVLSWDPKPDAYTFVTNGTAQLAVGWNARGQLYSRQSGGKLAAALPEEGSLFQINTLGLVKGSRQSDAAKAYIAYALSPEAQAAFAERMFYAPVNTKAPVSAAALSATAASPARMEKMLAVDWLEVAKFRNRLNEQWRRRILTRG
ncbi:ABC transporter substrate-binding protein [Falsiroseomonas selenitidurans]|uniref:ABC transporter substrate-binding protein n=1 Tax=Falsiroseomonas selenitidurans TaxID=2716335 RepID=A0ABX1EA97_9PROT|nr:ABC transporter substrate-binding protein [Falsiroseomonas selenitidurans]NKC34144.1 ABC transporter substrate-binding protein [Falsiroseomonas selenitidurans]